ncbi:MAG TPA: hypothetical protein PLN21_02385 [Gemmatales bacterium]|nr:hypothetical protein [Gemmatales bacterium]
MIKTEVTRQVGQSSDDHASTTKLDSVVPARRLRLIQLAHEIRTAFESGASGFTLEPFSATDIGRIYKYAVGVAGYESRFARTPTHRECLGYLCDVAFRLTDPKMPRYLGGWISPFPQEYVLDVVELFDDFSSALDFANANGQMAFTQLFSLEEFNVEQEMRRSIPGYRAQLIGNV